MLVLTRKIGERIVIDQQIVVEVLSIHGQRVRLGIKAPRGQGIFRQELLDGETEASAEDPSAQSQTTTP